MISLLSKYKRSIFIVVVVVFIGSMFFISGQIFSAASSDSVAEVGGKKIPYQRFSLQVSRVLDSMRSSGTDVSDAVAKNVKQDVFREMLIEELFSQQAEKLNITVPDFEVAVEIQNTPQFTEGGAFNPRLYYQTIYNEFRMAPKEYESWRKKARLSSKFKQFMYTNIKVAPGEVQTYYLAKNKTLKDFEKDKAKYQDELYQAKFSQVANYLLRQMTAQVEIKSYLEQREQGK